MGDKALCSHILINIKIMCFFFKEDFHHSPVRNKDYQKVCSSLSDPVHFEVDASHEKLESNLEADARNVSSLCQDLTRSDSPFYMDTSSTNSDLPQVCITCKF